MKKNYLFLALLLMLNTLLFSQSVSLTPTSINGQNVNGTLNLASAPNSTVTLVAKVQLPNNAAAGDNGTLKIYYTNLSTVNANIAAGGDGSSLYFGGGKIATVNFTVNLYWSDFSTSGGFIYAEYKTPTNVVYRSSNLAVIKNSTMTSGTTLNPPADAPNPTKIPNTLCCNQTIRLGDKPQPIVGSQYLNPYDREPYGIGASWKVDGNLSAHILGYTNKILELDYITQPGNFTVKRDLGYIYGNEFPNKSNIITITVVPSPILTNDITTSDVFLNPEGYYELSNVKSMNINGFSSKVNLNILNDPSHVNKRGDNIVDIDSYRWEYKDIKYTSNPWITIPNETGSRIDFSDPSKQLNFEDTSYAIRRIAIYKNISRASNEIKVLIRGIRYENTICCDQLLKIYPPSNFESPQIINGSTVNVDKPILEGINFRVNYITYQWQSQNTTKNIPTSTWSNISGATSKDYFPSQQLTVDFDRRGNYSFTQSYKYRRIAYINYSVIINNNLLTQIASSYSNESSLDGSIFQSSIQFYPNPTSSILNIDCTVDISNSNVTITNITGTVVNSNNYFIVNPKSISIDVSNLITGTYFITIENQNLGIVQKTFIKQ